MNFMSPELVLDLGALARNWRELNTISYGKAGAVVKADGYGLGVNEVAKKLWAEGARVYFVATMNEALELSKILEDAIIYELSGQSVFTQMPPNIRPVINAISQLKALDDRSFALQFDTGMTRLGLDISELDFVRGLNPSLIMSHLSSADEPDSSTNTNQLRAFRNLGESFPHSAKSLAATGGILLNNDYHFDLTRPGIGIYGGAPFLDAEPVIQIHLPVIQVRDIKAGCAVGYNGSFVASQNMRVATVLGGYADGLSRQFSNKALMFFEDTPCPILGRVSMDAVTVDISALEDIPDRLSVFHANQTINDLAEMAGTISYEILTGLGSRFQKRVVN